MAKLSEEARRLLRERKEKQKRENRFRWLRMRDAVDRKANELGVPVVVTHNQAIRVAGEVDIFPLSRRLVWLRSNHWEDLDDTDSVVTLAAAKARTVAS